MEFHLVSLAKQNIIIDTASHFAIATKYFDQFIKHLNEKNINYLGANDKPHTYSILGDGVKQLYFKDPDGYCIEVNNIGQK